MVVNLKSDLLNRSSLIAKPVMISAAPKIEEEKQIEE
jgi:hypothetical protein